MTFTITFGWWVIPTLITVLGLIWALFIVDKHDGWLGRALQVVALVPVLVVSCVSWIIAGVLKS